MVQPFHLFDVAMATYNKYIYIYNLLYILGRCLQHRGGEPERAKGADGMQLFALDCIAYIVDVETN